MMKFSFIPFMKAAQKPLFLIVLSLILGIYLIASSFFYQTHEASWISQWLGQGVTILLILSIYWLVLRFINTLTQELKRQGETSKSSIIQLIYPLINRGLKIIIFLLVVNLILLFLKLPENYLVIVQKGIAVILIIAIGWLGLRLVHIFEQITLRHFNIQVKDEFRYRKVQTQITVLKKIASALVIFLSFIAILMLSDKVRELGATLLASAGIIAAIATFAAQKTLTGIVGGIQIALTQPIHLNDVVAIENEIGQIEEISLNYVVMRLQDNRKFIVPINYFIEKSFQNLSRNRQEIQGKICLYVNYCAEIEPIRQAFQEILKTSRYWNQKIGDMQITETKPNQMELQFLISAENNANLWNLQCETREKLILYLKTHYPTALG